jgi:hypothetical protein
MNTLISDLISTLLSQQTKTVILSAVIAGIKIGETNDTVRLLEVTVKHTGG